MSHLQWGKNEQKDVAHQCRGSETMNYSTVLQLQAAAAAALLTRLAGAVNERMTEVNFKKYEPIK